MYIIYTYVYRVLLEEGDVQQCTAKGCLKRREYKARKKRENLSNFNCKNVSNFEAHFLITNLNQPGTKVFSFAD